MSYPKQILFASTNQGKLIEVRAIAKKFGLEILSPDEIAPDWPKVEENGKNYQENARLKAQAFFAWSKLPSLADDSGLEVEALGAQPGIFSSRYAGEHATDAQNRAKLLKALQGINKRCALFRCSLCLVISDSNQVFSEGVLEGEIGLIERGKAGFGYDSIFLVSGSALTLSELKAQKSPIKTHRIKALENLFAQFPSN